MLSKTEAVVLKAMKYGDTSKIVTFYTRQYGKLKGIAKGARKANNKFGSSLEPLSRVVLVLYKKENRDLHLISQCDGIESYRRIHEDLDRMSAGLSVLELVDLLTHGEEESFALYSLTVGTLKALNEAEKNFGSLSRAFTLKCSALFGYTPVLDTCSKCGKSLINGDPLSPVVFNLANGAIVCDQCREHSTTGTMSGNVRLSPATLRVMQHFLSSSTEHIAAVSYNEQIGNELDETLRLYMKQHFDQTRELRSTKVFRSIIQ